MRASVVGLRARCSPTLAGLTLAWLAACGGPGPSAVGPGGAATAAAPPAADEARPEPVKVEEGAWLAWRQDVGGVVRTALIEQAGPRLPDGERAAETASGPGGPPTPARLTGSLTRVPAGPSVAPGQAARVTMASQLLLAGWTDGTAWRFHSASPATARWSVAPCGEEALAFAKGLQAREVLKSEGGGGETAPEIRQDVSDPGLRPGPGANATHREFVVFSGQDATTLWVRHVTISGPCPLGATARREVAFALDLARGTLAPADGVEAPALTKAALEARVRSAPAAVRAFWEAQAQRDVGREVEREEVGLYGGVGWSEVPRGALPAVRALVEATRDAPTPSGPTDWD